MLGAGGVIHPRHFPCPGAGQAPAPDGTVPPKPPPPPPGPSREELALARDRARIRALQLLGHLDRCVHGRREGAQCFPCPGNVSVGNEFLKPETRIGTSLLGEPIMMPADPERRGDPLNWIRNPFDR